ncbi:unnamed protein product [Alopecurus aequalis]
MPRRLARIAAQLFLPNPPFSLRRACSARLLRRPRARSTDTSSDQSALMDQPSSRGSTSSQEDKSDASSRIVRSKVEVQLHHLPLDILQAIFSRLSIKEVVRMSLLSSEWRRLRICHPDLVFTKETFLGSNTSTDTDTTSADEFITKVDSVLHPLWSTSTTSATTLNKFVVKFGLDRSHKDHIDKWISFSTALRAKHVGLVFKLGVTWSDSEDDKYDVPLCNFSGPNGSCVESLDMCYVCLKLPPSFCGIRNLKKLMLHTVSVSISDFQCLLLSCDLLESLNIEEINWLGRGYFSYPTLCIHQKLCRLQYLRMCDCRLSLLELHAPNLATIDFDNRLCQIVLIESLKLSEATFSSHRTTRTGVHDALGMVWDRVPTDLPHLHRLFLDLPLETSVRSFSKTHTRFMKLRYLNINLQIAAGERRLPEDTSWVMGLVNLLELTPLLEELELHMNAHNHCRGNNRPASRMVKAVQGHINRHLTSVYMTGVSSIVGVIELALYILGNSTALERMVVDSVVRNGHGSSETDQIYSVSKASEFVPPSRDEQYMYGMVMDRKFVKEHLDREEYRHVLTIL